MDLEASLRSAPTTPSAPWQIAFDKSQCLTITEKVLGHAIQIQGPFSTISDVFAAYVEIFNSCMRVGIDKMDHLAVVEREN